MGGSRSMAREGDGSDTARLRRDTACRVPELVVVNDQAALGREAAERFARIAEAAVASAGRFTVALAGGSTPKTLYALLATEPYRSRIPWSRTAIFWGDERCVPPDQEESNYRMVNDALLRHLPALPEGVYRMRGEDPDPTRAAADFEQLLRSVFGLEGGALPRFDLILLGMGADGHTASLFPGSAALREIKRLVVATSAGTRHAVSVQANRLTLTLPVLNEASAILFLVSERDKAEMLHVVLDAAGPDDGPPAQQVRPRDGRLTWLVDRAAASLLEGSSQRGEIH